LNTQLDSLSSRLKNKESELDTERKTLETQVTEAIKERDDAVEFTTVLKDKLSNIMTEKHDFETI